MMQEILYYLRKIPCIYNFLWFRVFLFRFGCRDIWKNVQNETTKLFLVGNTRINSYKTKANYVYEVLQNCMKLDKFCSWKQQSRLKCYLLCCQLKRAY